MLRRVALYLSGQGYIVSVIARRRDGLTQLEQDAAEMSGRIDPIACDYSDSTALRRAIDSAIATYGPFTLIVAWTRESVPRAQGIIAKLANKAAVESGATPCRFFRVLGSLAGDPARLRLGKGAEFKAEGTRTIEAAFHHTLDGIAYREIILGFRIECGISRWNTHEEIQSGVIEAIERDLPESIIGAVTPWEMNPRLRAGR